MLKDVSHVAFSIIVVVKTNPEKMPNGAQINNIVIQTDFSFSEPKASAHTGVKIITNTYDIPVRNLITILNLKFLDKVKVTSKRA